MKFKITSKNIERTYDVENHFKAIKTFFLEIAQSKIDADEIGLMAYCEASGMDNRPFRTLPALYSLGIISWTSYRINSQQIAKMSRKELVEMADKDKWMGSYIQAVLDGSDDPEDELS